MGDRADTHMRLKAGSLSPLLVGVALFLPLQAGSQETLEEAFGSRVAPAWESGSHRQFDFWIGRWTGIWRSREAGNFFHADGGLRLTHWVFPVLDGKAVVELSHSLPGDTAVRVAGFSIRYFDGNKDRWVMAQDWPGWTLRGFVDQLQGFERQGRVQVLSTYPSRGGQRTRRYSFSDVREGYFRWDDASTGDGGATWAQGSIVEFHRESPAVALGSAGGPLPNGGGDVFCAEAGFSRLAGLEGRWEAQTDGGTPVGLTVARMNAGCAVLAVVTTGESEELFAWTYVPDQDVFTQLHLAGTEEATHELSVARNGTPLLFERNTQVEIRDELAVLDVSTLLPNRTDQRTSLTIEEESLSLVVEVRSDEGWSVQRALTFRRR